MKTYIFFLGLLCACVCRGQGTIAIQGVVIPTQGQGAPSAGVSSITGTANQVVASASTGAVTLSLPQSIATTSSPTFVGLTLSGTGAFTTVTQTGKTTTYNNVATVGSGLVASVGLDNRTGLTSGDGSAITLFTTVNGTSLFRVTADIFATAAVTGTAIYTITWTQNATTQTLTVNSTTINTLATATDLINPDNATNITGRLTGSFTGTFTVAGLVEQIK